MDGKTLKPMMLSEAVGAPVSPLNVSTKIFKICKISSELLRRNPFSIDLKILTILAWKNLIQYKNSLKYKVAASDVFNMFTQSIKFFYFYDRMSEKHDSSSRQ